MPTDATKPTPMPSGREINIRYFWQHDDTGAWTVLDTNLGVIETLDFWSHFHNMEMRHTLIARVQFTGLQDENGKELFGGDIVKVPDAKDRGDGSSDDGLAEVYFDVEFAGWLLRGDIDSPDHISQWVYDDGTSTLEIVGNRFEHPHLLEAKP